MIKLTTLSAVLVVGLSTSAFCQVTGPAAQQDTNKQGYANPNTPNMRTDGDVVVVPAAPAQGTIERGTVGSAMDRPVQVVPVPERSIDGTAATPAGR